MGRIVKIYEMLLKNYILVGLGKILVGRNNFERSGKKLEMSGKKFRKKCMQKNPGGQKLWQRGGGEIS